jgi:hypothetical protein
VAVALAPPAQAVEHEHHVGVGLGPSVLVASGRTGFGGAVDVHYLYGINDTFNLMVEGSFSLLPSHAGDDALHTRPSRLGSGDVGVSYVFDVLSWVPYVGVLGGAYVLDGGSLDHAKVLPAVVLAAGLDYRIDRSWVVGVAVREHLFFTEASTYPSLVQVLARVEYTWGW